jgi:hypothetical protein
MMSGRREFLGWAAGLGALAVPRRAGALRLEEANVGQQQAFDDRCGKNETHAAFKAEVEGMLAQSSLAPEEKQALLAALECPVCGCSVLALGLF